jgi:glycosyltransferase involved in cell wall biosynthesis
MPEVSVIVPNYNHGPYLAQRLDSIFSQTYGDFEVIILDDNSSDDSAEVIRRYATDPRVAHVALSSVNSGSPFRQWKRGLELSKGRVVWIAESDDYADQNFLQQLVPLMKGDVRLAYCASQNIDDRGRPVKGLDQWLAELSSSDWDRDYVIGGKNEISRHLSIRNTMANTSSVLIERESLERFVDALSPFRYTGDWYLWLLILSEPGARIAYCAQRMNFFRSHQVTTRFGTTSFSYLDEWLRCLHFARKAGLSRELHVLAYNDLKEMSMRIPSRILFSGPVMRTMSRWMAADPVFTRIVYQSLIERIPFFIRKLRTAL